MLFYLLLQATAPQPADIELKVDLRARSVEIERRGEAELTVNAEPDAGSFVETDTTPTAEGRTKLRNVQVKVRAEARIAPPSQIDHTRETPEPQ